jgi:hypothetical protein
LFDGVLPPPLAAIRQRLRPRHGYQHHVRIGMSGATRHRDDPRTDLRIRCTRTAASAQDWFASKFARQRRLA